jgi:hypothetical protein
MTTTPNTPPTPAQTSAGELAEPRIERRTRSVRALWPVGQPDEQGFQAYAALAVTHFGTPRYEYTVVLRRVEIKAEPWGVTERLLLTGGAQLRVESVAARRYSGRRIEELPAAGLRTVRTRYRDQDTAVRALFEPAPD